MFWNRYQQSQRTHTEASTVPRIRFPNPSCSSWVLVSAGCLWCQNAYAPSMKYLESFCIHFLVGTVLLEKSHHMLPWLIRDRNWFLSEMTSCFKTKGKIGFIPKSSNGSNPIQWIFNFKTKPEPSLYLSRYGDLKTEAFWTGFLCIICRRILMTVKWKTSKYSCETAASGDLGL